MLHRKIIVFLIFSLLSSQLLLAGSVIKFRKNGTFLVNGKATIVYGAFRDPSDNWRRFDNLKKAGFNLCHDYYFEDRAYRKGVDSWIKDASEYLDLAEKAGIGVFLGIPREMFWRVKTDEIKKIVSALKDKPALWFWYMMDEPVLQYKKWVKKGVIKDVKQAINVTKKVYETIKSVDPNHPAVLVAPYKRIKLHPEFGKYCDSVWPDVYAHRYSIVKIKRSLKGLQSLYPGKPNLGVVHGGSLLPYLRRHAEKKGKITFPKKLIVTDKSLGNTPDVLWGNVNSALSGGSRGIIFYWAPRYRHNLIKSTPGNWKAMCTIGKNLRHMNAILASGNSSAGVRMGVDQWGHLNRQLELTGKMPDKATRKKYRTVAMWQRKYKNATYVGLACDFVPIQKVTLKLPFKFKKVSLMPSNEEVIKMSPDGKHKVNYKKLPVVLWNLKDNEIVFIMQDAKTIIFKFER